MLNKRTNSRDRMKNEINAGSMADIAFLLLIFFLVTTTIVEDKGILVRLPIWSDEEPDVNQYEKRNVFSVLINKNNQLLVRSEPADIKELKDRAIEFIKNPQKREDLSQSPDLAIISFKNDRGTNYNTYLTVYNELKAAYNEIWDEQSNKVFGRDFEALEASERSQVRAIYPMILSEAEPTAFGEE